MQKKTINQIKSNIVVHGPLRTIIVLKSVIQPICGERINEKWLQTLECHFFSPENEKKKLSAALRDRISRLKDKSTPTKSRFE